MVTLGFNLSLLAHFLFRILAAFLKRTPVSETKLVVKRLANDLEHSYFLLPFLGLVRKGYLVPLLRWGAA